MENLLKEKSRLEQDLKKAYGNEYLGRDFC